MNIYYSMFTTTQHCWHKTHKSVEEAGESTLVGTLCLSLLHFFVSRLRIIYWLAHIIKTKESAMKHSIEFYESISALHKQILICLIHKFLTFIEYVSIIVISYEVLFDIILLKSLNSSNLTRGNSNTNKEVTWNAHDCCINFVEKV